MMISRNFRKSQCFANSRWFYVCGKMFKKSLHRIYLVINVSKKSLQSCEPAPESEATHLKLELGDGDGAGLGLEQVPVQVLLRLPGVHRPPDPEGDLLASGFDSASGLDFVGLVTASVANGGHYHNLFEMRNLEVRMVLWYKGDTTYIRKDYLEAH